MGSIELERFLQVVRKSQLVSDADLSSLLDEVSQMPPQGQPATANDLAQRLMAAGLLNDWQTENLLKGKYRGFTLGKYTLLGHLGTGGMSSVYLAEHPVMERLVAIKVLPKRYVENQNYLDRFRREARAVASLDHPNIVRAHDIDQDGDTHYIVMEYVDGQDLQAMVRADGPLDPATAADYIAQAALGLQHAHENGLIHRDVKPANCLVDKRNVVKLLDLGLAKFSDDDRPALSALYDDSVVGTADYLAPEQAVNSQTVDWRADIYGLGCTLYFCLTGRPPFPEGSIATRLLKHQTEEPTSITQLRREVPPFLVDFCRRMMTKSPERRIQTAGQVAEALATWLARCGKATPYLRTQSTARAARGGSSTPWGPSSSSTVYPGGRRDPPSGLTSAETVSSARGDTQRIAGSDSSMNDELSLAPIEEERPKETVQEVAPQPTPTPVEPPPESSATNLTGLKEYESGPLDSLMRDKKFSRSATLPRKQLTRRKPPKKVSAPLIMLITVLTLFGLAALTLIVTIIVTSL